MIYYSIHFNRPDFVEIQWYLSKKIGYDLFIINNGSNPLIKEVCDKLGITNYIETINVGGNGSLSHGSSINQILSIIDMRKDWGLIDHDMFITMEIDFKDFEILTMRCNNIPSTPYMWPGMLLCKGGVDLSDVDFRPGVGIPADTGSDTYRYVNKYNVKWCDVDFIGERNKSLQQDSNLIMRHSSNGKLIGYHYLNGSNWTGGNPLEFKNDILNTLI